MVMGGRLTFVHAVCSLAFCPIVTRAIPAPLTSLVSSNLPFTDSTSHLSLFLSLLNYVQHPGSHSKSYFSNHFIYISSTFLHFLWTLSNSNQVGLKANSVEFLLCTVRNSCIKLPLHYGIHYVTCNGSSFQ